MTKKEQEKGKTINIADEYGSARWSVYLLSTSYTLGVIAILGGGGYWLDQITGKSPLFMIIGLAVGFPLTQIIIYKKSKDFSKKKVDKHNK